MAVGRAKSLVAQLSKDKLVVVRGSTGVSGVANVTIANRNHNGRCAMGVPVQRALLLSIHDIV